MIIQKKPYFENDDYLLKLSSKNLSDNDHVVTTLYRHDRTTAAYYDVKRQAFANRDTRPENFTQFIDDRPSLRSLTELNELDSTIYTVAAGKQNGTTYDALINGVREHLQSRPNTRRCVVRFAHDFSTYSASELLASQDVTCLSFIHYSPEGPRLVFRASDVMNELVPDILTINEFFLKPIYGDSEYQISIYSSTTQNTSGWSDTIFLLNDLENLNEEV